MVLQPPRVMLRCARAKTTASAPHPGPLEHSEWVGEKGDTARNVVEIGILR